MEYYYQGLGLELWCLTPFSTILHVLCRRCQFYWLRKPEYLEKTTRILARSVSNCKQNNVAAGGDVSF
jgi:hypothetical protein